MYHNSFAALSAAVVYSEVVLYVLRCATATIIILTPATASLPRPPRMAVSGIHRSLFNGATTKGGDCGGRHGYAPCHRVYHREGSISLSSALSFSLLFQFSSRSHTAREYFRRTRRPPVRIPRGQLFFHLQRIVWAYYKVLL